MQLMKYILFLFFFLLTGCEIKHEKPFDSSYSMRENNGSILKKELSFHLFEHKSSFSDFSHHPFNIYLWNSALYSINNFPGSYIDQKKGIIVTDWKNISPDEKIQIIINIHGKTLAPTSFKIEIKTKKYIQNQWQEIKTNPFLISNFEDKMMIKARLLHFKETKKW